MNQSVMLQVKKLQQTFQISKNFTVNAVNNISFHINKGEIFGLVGMVIGVPLFAVIYSIIKENVEYKLREKNLPTDTKDYM